MASSPPGKTAQSSDPAPPATKRYTIQDLKSIGQACSTRLPPASAVQAMFLYELQRQSESERLFDNLLFRLADAEDSSKAHEALITAQDRRLKSLRKRVCELVEDRRRENVDARIGKLEAELVSIEAAVEAFRANVQALFAQVPEQLAKISQAVETLVGQHDDLSNHVGEHDKRLSKHGDLIRCLTSQQTMSQAEDVGQFKLAHEIRLPVRSIQGRPFELIIPKGSPMPVSRDKENRRPEQTNVMTRPLQDVKISHKGLAHSMFAVDG